MSMMKSEHHDESSSTGREVPDHTAGAVALPNVLRRIPRLVLLVLSAITLIANPLAWVYQNPTWNADRDAAARGNTSFSSWDWWVRPKVRNADAALPEISGRIYGISIERREGGRERIWIVGAGGLLAHSDDEGRCWTRLAYDATRGEFREPTNNPCGEKQAAITWPQFVPTVFAAEQEQSSAPSKQPIPQQQGTAEQRPSSTRPQSSREQNPAPVEQQRQSNPPNASKGVPSGREQNASPVQQTSQAQTRPDTSVSRAVIRVFPTDISFGNLTVSNFPGTEQVKSFSIQNAGTVAGRVYVSGVNDDKNGEFEIEFPSCSPVGKKTDVIEVGKACEGQIRFMPKEAGKKSVTITLQSDGLEKPVTVNIFAMVDKAPSPPEPKPTVPAPALPKPAVPTPTAAPAAGPAAPPIAPDLLAISEFPDTKIVSTGGWVWTLNKNGAWVGEPQKTGAGPSVAGVSWEFDDPAKNVWASETKVRNLAALNLATDRYNCTDCTIRAEVKSSSGVLWAVGWSKDSAGEHGVIYHSQDGGAQWHEMTRGAFRDEQTRQNLESTRAWVWPPNWYWAVLVLSVLLAIPALLPPPDVTAPKGPTSSVEGRLSSDKPLDPGDLDVLGLTGIALGLSRFLRNKKTLPPLTIAVNGEWGSGKSSLMNLLRSDLKSYGMKPVWFNAWHHQKEEYLLAALLQSVRHEAVPPLWSLLGIPFRLRLLHRRFKRRWQPLVLLACALIFLIALDYYLRIPGGDHRTNLFLWIANQFSSPDKATHGLSTLPVHGGFLAAVAGIAALWKGLTAFGANPAVLLASVAKGNKIKDLDAQTSFRQKFAVEFRDFTRALGPKRPLVVFIDDLDRCLPENVRDVLEAVNFLVSSGDCFVVLGIDRVQVQRAIGLSFKEVAEEAGRKDEVPAGEKPKTAEQRAREQRAEFAQKYLEKLINLEVRVPQAADDGTKQQLFKRTETPTEGRLDVALRYGLQFSKWAVPTMVAVLLLVGTARLGKMAVPSVEGWIKETIPPPEANQKPDVNAAATNTGPAANTPGPKPKAAEQKSASNIKEAPNGEVVSPASGSAPEIRVRSIWPARWILSLPLYLAALFVLLVTNVVLTTRPGVVTHDSKEFTDAMEEVWYPLVLAKQNTPRTAKRFINRVRYLAMRQQGYQEHASLWERVLWKDRLREPARATGWQPIPEPLLVALAAIEQVQPQWIYNDDAFKLIKGSDGINDLNTGFPANIPQATTLLKNARMLHREKFTKEKYPKKHVDWDSLPAYRDTFLSIWPQLSLEPV